MMTAFLKGATNGLMRRSKLTSLSDHLIGVGHPATRTTAHYLPSFNATMVGGRLVDPEGRPAAPPLALLAKNMLVARFELRPPG
jgi:hypothetical protein